MTEHYKGKNEKKAEDSLSDIWDNIKHQHSNQRDSEEKKKVYEKIRKESIVKTFLTLERK